MFSVQTLKTKCPCCQAPIRIPVPPDSINWKDVADRYQELMFKYATRVQELQKQLDSGNAK